MEHIIIKTSEPLHKYCNSQYNNLECPEKSKKTDTEQVSQKTTAVVVDRMIEKAVKKNLKTAANNLYRARVNISQSTI